ncbi:MAG: hypothetical protein ACREOZ_00035 [Gloeomargaritales cyanobacterium]
MDRCRLGKCFVALVYFFKFEAKEFKAAKYIKKTRLWLNSNIALLDRAGTDHDPAMLIMIFCCCACACAKYYAAALLCQPSKSLSCFSAADAFTCLADKVIGRPYVITQ